VLVVVIDEGRHISIGKIRILKGSTKDEDTQVK
jgi:hypothetical protein